jgi:ssDNA-binding Zn-finger/Zn-ribbon topoisomerase 1
MKPRFEDGLQTDIHCPDCGGVFIVRTNKANGGQFLGCSNWPDCQNTRPIPEEWVMRAQGQAELFGETK